MKSLKNTITTIFLTALILLLGACVDDGVVTVETPVESTKEEVKDNVEIIPVVDDNIAIVQYNDDIIEVMEYIAVNVSGAIEVINMIDVNPILTGSPEVVLKLDDIVLALEDNRNQINNLTPPTDYAKSYDMILTGVQEYINGVANYRDGLINKDNTLIDKSYEHLKNADIILSESTNHLPTN